MWRRRLFVTLSILSLLLCMAIAMLWCGSYLFTPKVNHFSIYPGTHEWRWHIFASARGGTLIGFHWDPTPRAEVVASCPRGWVWEPLVGSTPPEGWMHLTTEHIDLLGFRYGSEPKYLSSPSASGRVGVIPFWFLFMLCAILPLRWMLLIRGRWRREKRRKLGLCEHCGYDLRGSPDRCPECGAPS